MNPPPRPSVTTPPTGTAGGLCAGLTAIIVFTHRIDLHFDTWDNTFRFYMGHHVKVHDADGARSDWQFVRDIPFFYYESASRLLQLDLAIATRRPEIVLTFRHASGATRAYTAKAKGVTLCGERPPAA